MRVLLVIHRFGRDILGGAERLAWNYAVRLAERHAVTVATTRARDYRTWRDEFPAGPSFETPPEGFGFELQRFGVSRPRRMAEFNFLSRLAFRVPNNGPLARRWMRAQGPDSPALAEWIAANQGRFDAVLLFNYLYYGTWSCLPACANKAALVPLAHDEPPLALAEYRKVFSQPKALIHSSRAELDLLRSCFGDILPRGVFYGGSGVAAAEELPPSVLEKLPPEWLAEQPAAFREAWETGRCFLSLGRIAEAKDSHLLAEDFAKAFGAAGGPLPWLLMVGPREMARPELLPERPGVAISSSPAPEPALATLRSRALATLHASRHESLNLSAIESLAEGVPVLAHRRSRATAEIVADSGAGAEWDTPESLRGLLETLASRSPAERRAEAARAKAFARERFRWDVVIKRVEKALEFAAA